MRQPWGSQSPDWLLPAAGNREIRGRSGYRNGRPGSAGPGTPGRALRNNSSGRRLRRPVSTPKARRERSQQQPQGESRRRDGQAVGRDGHFRKAGGVENFEPFAEAAINREAGVGALRCNARPRFGYVSHREPEHQFARPGLRLEPVRIGERNAERPRTALRLQRRA